jgi:hypothetical protein
MLRTAMAKPEPPAVDPARRFALLVTLWSAFGWQAVEDVWPEITLAWLSAAAGTAALWLV